MYVIVFYFAPCCFSRIDHGLNFIQRLRRLQQHCCTRDIELLHVWGIYFLKKLLSFNVKSRVLHVFYCLFVESVLSLAIICWFRNATETWVTKVSIYLSRFIRIAKKKTQNPLVSWQKYIVQSTVNAVYKNLKACQTLIETAGSISPLVTLVRMSWACKNN